MQRLLNAGNFKKLRGLFLLCVLHAKGEIMGDAPLACGGTPNAEALLEGVEVESNDSDQGEEQRFEHEDADLELPCPTTGDSSSAAEASADGAGLARAAQRQIR